MIPAALLRDLRASGAGDVAGLARTAAATVGLAATATGYLAPSMLPLPKIPSTGNRLYLAVSLNGKLSTAG